MTRLDFVEWLKKERKKLGLSQRKLSTLAGMSLGCVGHYENYTHLPKPETIAKLKQALNTARASISNSQTNSPKKS